MSKLTMKYSDLDNSHMKQALFPELFSVLEKRLEIQRNIKINNRQVIEKNIDFIINSSCKDVIFSDFFNYSKEMPHYMSPKNVLYKGYIKTEAFSYPKNISKDWAEGLLDFISFWKDWINGMEARNQQASEKFSLRKYSTASKNLLKELNKVEVDLIEKVHGISPEQQKKNKKSTNEFIKNLINEISSDNLKKS